jgi:hypothetical protein
MMADRPERYLVEEPAEVVHGPADPTAIVHVRPSKAPMPRLRGMGETPETAAGFVESKHRRDRGGKFARKTGAKVGRARSMGDAAGAKAFVDSHYGAWRKSISDDEFKALSFYQSPGFALMNGQLRGLDKASIKADVSFGDADLKRAREASRRLAGAIGSAPPLKEPIVVHRGFSADQFGELRPGQIIQDKGFTSTSLTPDVSAVGRATMPGVSRITLPAGTKAGAGSARELILPPGSKFRVISVKPGKVPHVELELIP